MDKHILEVNAVNKEFYGQPILKDLTFKVAGGRIFGLLGPNGAGKTTAMRIIMNILKPDSGEILYNNTLREKMPNLHFGYLPEERGLYPKSTVLDLLVYFGTLNNLKKRKAEVEAIRYLDRLGLVDYSDTQIGQLSKGMQQKIQFIASFLHDPDVLILDEPFSGLDPINQVVLRDILSEYKAQKKILIISTHQMDIVEKICDDICLINQGEAILQGNLKDIKKTFRENAYLIEADNSLDFLHDLKDVDIIEEKNNAYKFKLGRPDMTISDFFNLTKGKIKLRKFEIVEPTLHDIFIRLIREQG
jgi:ABC-2 type transport system ATP-binding protein